MSESERVHQVAIAIADAIGRKDADAVAAHLAPGFILRSPGREARDRTSFLDTVRHLPVEILSVRLETIEIDVSDAGALATGIQHAQVRLDGAIVDDRRGFVDWFVRHEGEWRLRVAVDLPSPDEDPPAASAGTN
jgi:ketosteroid isomerase-like protein